MSSIRTIPSRVVVSSLRRAASLALVTLGLLTLVSASSIAQTRPATAARWEFLVSSGRLIPTGVQRDAIARGGVTAAQLAFVPGPVALTATLGWARSRDIALEGRPKLDAFMYDLGAEARAPEVRAGAWSVKPFGGAGVGARSYNYRSLEADATHNLAGYVSAGTELGYRRVRLRLEGRNYFTGFKPLTGLGSSDRRNDVVLIAGLRLAPRR